LEFIDEFNKAIKGAMIGYIFDTNQLLEKNARVRPKPILPNTAAMNAGQRAQAIAQHKVDHATWKENTKTQRTGYQEIQEAYDKALGILNSMLDTTGTALIDDLVKPATCYNISDIPIMMANPQLPQPGAPPANVGQTNQELFVTAWRRVCKRYNPGTSAEAMKIVKDMYLVTDEDGIRSMLNKFDDFQKRLKRIVKYHDGTNNPVIYNGVTQTHNSKVDDSQFKSVLLDRLEKCSNNYFREISEDTDAENYYYYY
jgi:hypothetical protein